ncbi:sulfurtransferase [Amycolatopsis nigrescens]|uniref:sulfurtransferase n=1 Tax=Amycolatopsis nigrescens TaxID=381445 RepID=UPI000376870B|nr:sulfurtransferase [Amycolatopsis nigrescens]
MGVLVSVEGLRAAIDGTAPPVVLDVRWTPGGPPGISEFREGHIPGARYAELDTELAAPPGDGGRHPLPDPAAFGETLRRLGVRHDRPVVVCDRRDSTIAARLWWMLCYHGHPDVRVLDGGYQAWVRAGFPSATGDEPAVEPGDFTVRPGAVPMVTAAEVSGLARNGILLDARAAERYRGEVEPIDPVAGHIPGAVSAPTAENVDAEGRFRPVPELRERFAGLGITPDSEVAAYCGSGVTAAHEVLALRLAGFDAALYVGSWSDWITDPTREVARGADPK